MKSSEFLDYHRNFCEAMHEMVRRKNADYSPGEFAFKNFMQIELDGLASTEVGIWTRIRDKTSRLISFLKTGSFQVTQETVEDTILDACNYLIILAAYLKYKRQVTELKFEYGEKYVYGEKTPA